MKPSLEITLNRNSAPFASWDGPRLWRSPAAAHRNQPGLEIFKKRAAIVNAATGLRHSGGPSKTQSPISVSEPSAAPGPILGIKHQPCLCWIILDIAYGYQLVFGVAHVCVKIISRPKRTRSFKQPVCLV